MPIKGDTIALAYVCTIYHAPKLSVRHSRQPLVAGSPHG